MEVTNQPQVFGSNNQAQSRENMPVVVRVEQPARAKSPQRDRVDFSDAEYANYDEVFDEEQAKREQKEKMEAVRKHQQDMQETADKLEEIDSKYAKGASKLFRYGAAAVGIVGTFFASKYSSKLLIETLKTAAKNPSLKNIPNAIGKIKDPAMNLVNNAKGIVDTALKNPKIAEKIEKVANSSVVKTAKTLLDNKAVSKVLEPLKNTLASVKDIKINGKSIQSAVENTMAATTTGCVIIDDLTGRNNDKSTIDLATGS